MHTKITSALQRAAHTRTQLQDDEGAVTAEYAVIIMGTVIIEKRT